MASPTMTDGELAKEYGYSQSGQTLFGPQEFGYRCPKGHGGNYLTWSEFNEHIWCHKCWLDYRYCDCTLKRPSWMKRKYFNKFVADLPIKPRILKGVDRWMEEVDKPHPRAEE